MSQISALFSTSNEQEATQAWRGGVPQAKSIASAREQWKPYLKVWAQEIKHTFSISTPALVGRHRVGWIDDAEFWTSFWENRTQVFQDENTLENIQIGQLQPYVDGAAAATSLSFFKTMPRSMVATVETMLEDTKSLFDISFLQWYMKNPDGFLFSKRRQVLNMQDKLMTRCEWSTPRYRMENTFISKNRGDEGVAYYADLLNHYISVRQPPAEMQLKWLGHLMLHLDASYDRDEFTKEIVARKGPHLTIDPVLVMICSGYEVKNGTDACTTLSRMGGLLTREIPVCEDDKFRPEIVSVLNVMNSITNTMELYQALENTGLHKKSPDAYTDVNSEIFAQASI